MSYVLGLQGLKGPDEVHPDTVIGSTLSLVLCASTVSFFVC